jgi:hypothetical protein
MHSSVVVLTDLSCGDSDKGIMFISNMRPLQHWMSGPGTLSFKWRRCCQIVCCCWQARMAKNVVSIPKTMSHVIYPLRIQFILSWPSCQRVFHVLCVGRGTTTMLLCDQYQRDWHMTCLRPSLDSLPSGQWSYRRCWGSSVLGASNSCTQWRTWFSPCCTCLNGKWEVMV